MIPHPQDASPLFEKDVSLRVSACRKRLRRIRSLRKASQLAAPGARMSEAAPFSDQAAREAALSDGTEPRAASTGARE